MFVFDYFLSSPKAGRGIQRAELGSHVGAGERAEANGGAVRARVWRCIGEWGGREQRGWRSVGLLDMIFLFANIAVVASFGLCFISFNRKYWFSDTEQPDEDDMAIDDYYDDLYCPACDKSFKSDKAWVMLPGSPGHSLITLLFKTSC